MPEASIHEEDSMPLGEHNVRMSGQLGGMETVAESQSMEVAANDHFWLRVL